MLKIYKIALGPILLVQARWLRRTALRLPEATGPRSGVEGGYDSEAAPLRILVVGDSSAAGVGVSSQAEALAQPVAKLLAMRTGRSVAWQLIAKSGVNTSEALELLTHRKLCPVDYLITALGTNDVTSQRNPTQFLRDYVLLADTLRKQTGAVGLVATGLPPLRILPAAPHPLRWYLGRCAIRLDRALRNWIERDPTARYVSLEWAAHPEDMAEDGFHPGRSQYRRWAELVTEQIHGLLEQTFVSRQSHTDAPVHT
ncbi:SGNH/GDSL hydrolase family protein [Paraburkholderia edwinii]|uniref:SGNH/GDSL hydrolase family protein n=1 Tax=Paraburkholderia edwinii TaxID=2861782 RepID=A0ABX8UH58_9BURK|nr:SGNH/GDSL hydrolase family protein [Paraburkholderia edwinii]QYD68267.1 SGNH/GDSL hydrolase family protein [Paraburkholderia edwinii]